MSYRDLEGLDSEVSEVTPDGDDVLAPESVTRRVPWGRGVLGGAGAVVLILTLGWRLGLVGGADDGAVPGASVITTSAVATPSRSSSSQPGAVAEQPIVASSSSTAVEPSPGLAMDPAGALAVGRRFVELWARPDARVSEWRAALVPLATPQYGGLLGRTDPSVVPARVVRAAEVEDVNLTAASVLVATDAGRLRVRLMRVVAGWRVAGVDPVPSDVETEVG